MPLAMLVGRGEQTVLERLGVRPLAEADVTLCDARDLDPLERVAVASSRQYHFASVDELARLDFDDRPLHLHLDPDVIDPVDAPARLYPAPGGPSAEELARRIAELATRTRVTSVSLTGWALDRDASGATARAVDRIFGAALGGTAPLLPAR